MSILPKETKLWMQEGPACLHYVIYPAYAGTVELKKQADIYPNFIICMVKNELFLFAYDEKNMIELTEKILQKELENYGYSQQLIKKWKVFEKNFYIICKEIDNTNLSSLSKEELSQFFDRFAECYIQEYALPILADPFGYAAGVKTEKLLKEHLKKIGKLEKYNEILVLLTQPTEDSFIGEEKFDLLQIAKDYLDKKEIKEALKKHSKKWFWIQNNYLRSLVLDDNHFFKRVKEHAENPDKVIEELQNHTLKFDKIKKAKAKAIDELKIGNELQLVLKLVDIYTTWQDNRKRANVFAQHYLTTLLEEVSKRVNMNLEDLKYTFPHEVTPILNGTKLDPKLIKERKIIGGGIFYPDKANFLNYEDSKQLDKEVQAQYNTNGINDLYGMVANLGKVTNIVKIISGPKEFNKLNPGEILVTSMTRPDFMPVLKKAGAIITDEGGITCHAAIVARELGVPCIVGTKIATKVLKDNDKVEVNANHGIVRIIK